MMKDLSRRQLAGLLVIGGLGSLFEHSKASASSDDDFTEKLRAILERPDLIPGLRKKDEADFTQLGPVEERPPLRTAKSSTKISSRASNLIIACEVSGKSAYQKAYYRPTWPKGASGVTIGIGYDVGYVTPAELTSDWRGILTPGEIALLSASCGLTGERAQAILNKMQSVSVGWDDALKEYFEETQPRYVGLTEGALPNTGDLSPDSLGALVSLVYNRGAAFGISEGQDSTGRFREMRAIRDHMRQKAFDLIPNELLNMRRIWAGKKDMRGVVLRREAEAALFKQGLAAARS